MNNAELKTPDVSIVVPAKDEEKSLTELFDKIRETMEGEGLSFEVIFVDDGSTDSTFSVITGLAEKDGRVKGIRFIKNFGKSAALAAGFERARAKIIVTMDADLQDDPTEIPNLIETMEKEGAHLVSGWKKDRKDPADRKAASRIFNSVAGALSGVKVHDMNCGLKAYRREVTEGIRLYGDLHRFIPALAAARGFKVAEVPVRHHPRVHGRSRYGLERVPRGMFDLLTVIFLTQYARRPLHLFGGVGLGLGFLGFVALLYLTVLWFMGLGPIGTRPLFMGGIMLLLLGAQLLSLGLVGELITNLTYRPGEQYIVSEETGTE